MVATVAGFCDPAQAERWSLQPAVDTRATYTDNVSFDAGGSKQSDTIFELIPSLRLFGEGRRFRISGTVSADALTYARGTRDSRILPSVDLTTNLEAIERFFFIEAGVQTRQLATDAFAPSSPSPANLNTTTTTQYRLVPSFEGRVGGDVEYRLRSINTWTQSNDTDTTQGGAYQGDHSFRIERRPRAFGWALEVARSDTRFESATPDSAKTDSARLSLLYAFTQEFDVGVRGGYEKTNLVVSDPNHFIYGAQFNWRPTVRTNFAGVWEDRFFGASWNLRFDHRMPRFAWNVLLARDVVSFPQAFLTLPPTNNVAALLDAAFTTRFPDPTDRSRIVSDLIARQGLPSSLQTQTSLFAEQISIVQSRNVGMVYLGVRNSVAFNLFSSRTEALPDSNFQTATPQNVAQTGASVTLSNQLSTLTSLNTTASFTRARGLATQESNVLRQTNLQLQVTRQLAPKTTAFAGARRGEFVQKLGGVQADPVHENAAFVGLGHRF